jgi:hypothetical protein
MYAELIFHELTHDEIFIKDSVDFNENLASFFGQEFTKMFFKSQGKKFEADYEEYLLQLHDRHHLNQLISDYLPKFDSLYKSIEGLTITEKENKKYHFIEQFKATLAQQNFKNPNYREYLNSELEINNAYLLSYKRYSGHQRLLEQKLKTQFEGNILKMLDFYYCHPIKIIKKKVLIGKVQRRDFSISPLLCNIGNSHTNNITDEKYEIIRTTNNLPTSFLYSQRIG